MSIRDARLDECDELSELALVSKRHWGYDEAFMERCRPELIVQRHDVEAGRVFVSEDSLGRRQGFAVVLTDGADAVVLDMLFVDPLFIGHGVGRALVDEAVARARRDGATVMRIESDPYAAGFYERVGAVQVGTSRSWSTGRDLPLFELRT